MSAVERLGQQFADWAGLTGLPWDQYDEQGALLADPRFTYKDRLLELEKPFFDVVASLVIKEEYRDLRAAQGRAAITTLYNRLSAVSGNVWSALKNGAPILAYEEGVKIDKVMYKASLATIAAYAADGADLHYDGIMDDAVHLGKITPEDRERHADTVAQIFQAFVLLDEEGAFEDMKSSRPVAGVGVAPLAAGWVIVLVVAILGLCYLVWAVFIASKTQDKVVEWCDKLIEQGGTEQAQYCVESLQNMQNESLAQLFTPLNKVAVVAGIGLVAYLGVMMMPSVVQSFQLARREA